jgi:hypothetical protein
VLGSSLKAQVADKKELTLRPQALAYELEPSDCVPGSGDRPPQLAFQLLGTGYDLLVELADPDVFPSLDRSARRRGPRLIRKNLLWGGAEASLILAHAMPTLYARMDGRLTAPGEEGLRAATRGDDGEAPLTPAEHLRALETLKGYYPLVRDLLRAAYDWCLREFKVLEEGVPRGEVGSGSQPAMPYSAALLRHEDPSQDPALVAGQRMHARDHFINETTLKAVEFAIGMEDWPRVSDKVLRLVEAPEDPAVVRWRDRALAAWTRGSGPYLAVARQITRS